MFSPHFIVWSSFHFMWSVFWSAWVLPYKSWGGLAERTPETTNEILILKVKYFLCLRIACQLPVKRGWGRWGGTPMSKKIFSQSVELRWFIPHTNCPEIVEPKFWKCLNTMNKLSPCFVRQMGFSSLMSLHVELVKKHNYFNS